MLYPHYSVIKQQLKTITGLKLVAWYTPDATLHTSPAAFIEWRDWNPSNQSREANQGDAELVVHVVSNVLSTADGDIPDSLLGAHSDLENAVYDALQGLRGSELFSALEFRGWANIPEAGLLHSALRFSTFIAQLAISQIEYSPQNPEAYVSVQK